MIEPREIPDLVAILFEASPGFQLIVIVTAGTFGRRVAILFEASPGFQLSWAPALLGQSDLVVAILFEASPGFQPQGY